VQYVVNLETRIVGSTSYIRVFLLSFYILF